MQDKLLFIAPHEIYLKEYCSASILSQLLKTWSVTIAVPEGMQVPAAVSGLASIVRFENYSEDNETFSDTHRWITLINRKKSSSFLFQSKRVFPTFWITFLRGVRNTRSNFHREKFGGIRSRGGTPALSPGRYSAWVLIWLWDLLRTLAHSVRAQALRFVALAKVSSRSFREELFHRSSNLPGKSRIEPIVVAEEPTLLVVPSRGHEIVTSDVISAGRRQKVPSLMLVDNWDNLSSKTVLSHLPDYMGTWGPQSSSHAVDIQGMAPDRVFSVGAPRFDEHQLSEPCSLAEGAGGKNFLLYCGTSLYSREDKVLDVIDQTLHKAGIDLPVLYRPHPARAGDFGPGPSNRFGNLHLASGSTSNQAHNLYPSPLSGKASLATLVRQSLFCLGGLTSVLIETGFHRKRYIALAHREILNYKSPRKMFQSFIHFQGIEELDHVTVCRSLRSLPALIESHLANPDVPLGDPDDSTSLDYFYGPPPTSNYATRLGNLVGQLSKII